jgi:arylsulfatase A
MTRLCLPLTLWLLSAGATLWAENVSAHETQPKRPNVVLIFADDLGYGDVGVYGAERLRTPNIDRLAAEGIKFTDFYVNCPVCSGSRAALLTGCHYQRVGMKPVLFPRDNVGLHPDEVTIAELLKGAGYATACIGKWHQGHVPKFLPTRQGFDVYFGIPYSNDMWIDPRATLADGITLREGATVEQIRTGETKRNKVPLMRGEEVVEYPADQDTLTRRYTEEAAKFIRAHRERPFFVYLPHTMPHRPLHVSERFRPKGAAGEEALFPSVIAEVDWSVGEILRTLDELGLAEETLVIFTSDNGPAVGSAGPLRGRKASVYEGGIREPCLMRWPGTIPAGTVCREVTATIDILPTLAALAGAEMPRNRVIDGKDITPLLRGEQGAKSPHESYVLAHGGGAVRSGKWKFYPWPEGGRQTSRKPQNAQPKEKPAVQLYDLEADLGEAKNVAAEHAEITRQLGEIYRRHLEDLRKNSRPIGKAERRPQERS